VFFCVSGVVRTMSLMPILRKAIFSKNQACWGIDVYAEICLMQHSINNSLSFLANSEWLFFFDCIIILANCNNNNSGGTKLRQASYRIGKAIKDIRLIPKGLNGKFS
jgi:hypothetical protein